MTSLSPPGPTRSRIPDVCRVTILALLGAGPFAFGAVHEPAFIPLLIVAFGVGVTSWARGHWIRAHGGDVPVVPAHRLLLALHALVLVQLLPLPPSLLALVSPGSFSFYDDMALLPLREWRPITVSPADTGRGLAFLAGMSLLYAAVHREFQEARWRRRLAIVVVATGFVMTLEALLQSASREPTRIYGLWRPSWDWAVFGPYVNRNHFAGYLVMAIPLALAFSAEAFLDLRRAWERRRRRAWLALGEPPGSAAIRRSAVAVVVIVGVLASQSRGGFMAFVLSTAALPLAFRHRRQALLVIACVVLAGALWVDPSGLVQGFETRGVRGSRLELWADALKMFPRFPILGSGLNSFGTAYLAYQTIWKMDWYGEVHNDYLQVLLDMGLAGAGLTGALLLVLFRAASRAARRSPLDAGFLGGLLASAFHNLVDFNWQIPANAATFVALAAVAVRGAEPRRNPESPAVLTPPRGHA